MDTVVDKIQKLMNTAVDAAATPAEAATALWFAQRLMLKHRISEQQLQAHARKQAFTAGAVKPDDMNTTLVGLERDRTDTLILQAAAEVCGAGSFRRHTLGGVHLMLYGLPTDCAVAAELFTWLVQKRKSETKAYCRSRNAVSASPTGRSFKLGFAVGLMQKVRAERRAREQSTETVEAAPGALVVVGQAETALSRALATFAETRLRLRPSRRLHLRQTDALAHYEGRRRAQEISIDRRVVR